MNTNITDNNKPGRSGPATGSSGSILRAVACMGGWDNMGPWIVTGAHDR